MPKYYRYKVDDYYLYFTDKCIVEAFHVHASDKKLSEGSSAKFFVYSNGDTRVERKGRLSDKSIRAIQRFIKINYEEMYDLWSQYSDNGFYGETEK